MSADMLGISIREFARRAGCDEKVVRRKVKTQHLSTFSDGSLDPAHLLEDWRKGVAQLADSAGGFADNADTVPWSKAEAERIKENYAALLRQLSFDRESAAVVEIDDVVLAVIAEYAAVRRRMARVGTDVAAGLGASPSAPEIKAAIDAAVVAALDDLTV